MGSLAVRQNPTMSNKFPDDLVTPLSGVFWSNSVKPSEEAGESKLKLADSLGQRSKNYILKGYHPVRTFGTEFALSLCLVALFILCSAFYFKIVKTMLVLSILHKGHVRRRASSFNALVIIGYNLF